MVKSVQFEGEVVQMETNEGRIEKKKKDNSPGIQIEMKKYKITELSALTGKYRKIDAKLNVEEETNEGRSIMVNMKTSLFEVLKQNFINLLEKHELVENVQLVRTAKANTKNESKFDC